MATEFWYRASGVWRKAKDLHYKQGGVWRKAKEAWYRSGGVWRKVFSGFTVVGGNFSDFRSDNFQASVTFVTDGSVNSSGAIGVGNWGTPTTAGIGANYWIRMSIVSTNGTVGGGPYDQWLQLSSNRSATLGAAPAGSARTATISYLISDSVGGPTLGSGTISLDSDRS